MIYGWYYSWEDILRMTDFLYNEKEKIVRNSIRNDAWSAKENC